LNNKPLIDLSLDIASILLDHSGILWLGTRGNGLFRYNIANQSVENYLNDPDDPYSLSNNFISVIIEDRSGIIWVGSGWNGVNKIVQNKSQFRHVYPTSNNNKSLNNNLIWTFLEKSPDELWIGTENGINCLHKPTGTYTYIRHNTGSNNCLPGNKIRKFFRD